MIRQTINKTLASKGPMTIEEISTHLGVPRALVRSALTTEFYRQTEIDHPEHGKVTVWATRPSLRIDNEGRLGVPR